MREFPLTIALSLFLLLHQGLSSQNIDSLKSVIHSDLGSQKKIEVLGNISNFYISRNPDSAFIFIDRALLLLDERSIGNEVASDSLRAVMLWQKGMAFQGLQKFKEAEIQYRASEKLLSKIGDKGVIKQVKLNLLSLLLESGGGGFQKEMEGLQSLLDTVNIDSDNEILYMTIYINGRRKATQGNYSSAAETLIGLLDFPHAASRQNWNDGTINSIAYYLEEAHNYDLAKKYYLQSLKIENLPNHQMAAICSNLGRLHKRKIEYDSSFHYLKKAESIPNILPYNIYQINKQFSEIHFQLGDLKKAQFCLDKCQDVAESIENLQYLIEVKFQQGLIFSEVGNYHGANQLFQDVYEYSNRKSKTLSLDEKEQFLMGIVDSKVKQLNDPFTVEVFNQYSKLRDSIELEIIDSKIADLTTKYETEKKEAENQMLRQERKYQAAIIESQRIRNYAALGSATLLGIVALLFHRQSTLREQTNKLLSEKNKKIKLLHDEASHRFKNNLMFVSSLLGMQGRRLVNEEAKQAVKESESRIEAMSLLHKKLEAVEGTSFKIGDYLKELCDNLKNTYPLIGSLPEIIVQADELEFGGDTVVRLGLIVNELVTNSFKYAFENQLSPKINISLKEVTSGSCRLLYADNGIGLPENFDIEKSKSMGLKLIHSMIWQMKGTFHSENREGAFFQFNFECDA